MKGLVKGFTGTFSATGVGAALGVVAVLVILAWIGWGPERMAARLRQGV